MSTVENVARETPAERDQRDAESNGSLLETEVMSWEAIKDLKDGRVTMYTTTATVTTFLAAIEATLLTGNPPPPPSAQELRGPIGVQRFYLLIIYAAMICAIGITINSLILVDIPCTGDWKRRGESALIPLPKPHEWKRTRIIISSLLPARARVGYEALEIILDVYKYVGAALVTMQFLTYIWLYESNLIAGLLTFPTLNTALPIFVRLWSSV